MADIRAKYKVLKAKYAAALEEIESLKKQLAPKPAPKRAPVAKKKAAPKKKVAAKKATARRTTA